MNFLLKYVIFLFVMLLVPVASEAQKKGTSNPKKAVKMQHKTKEREKRAYEKTRKQVVKHRYDIQSDQTKEMIKESKKKAKENNQWNTKKEPWLKRIFKKNPHKKKKPKTKKIRI